jgi:hypothetical protein
VYYFQLKQPCELYSKLFSCRLQALFVIGSAKVRNFFDFPNSKRKFFKFLVSAFSRQPPPVEAGCKGTVGFSDFASDLRNFFFFSFCC